MAAIALAGCASRPPAPDSPPEIEVNMLEHRFQFDPTFTGLPAGRVVFRMLNVGQESHTLSLIPLDDDVPIDTQVRSTERRAVQPLAGVNDRLSGATGIFAADVVAGRRYALIRYAYGIDEVAHSQKGMTWEGRAQAAAPSGAGQP